MGGLRQFDDGEVKRLHGGELHPEQTRLMRVCWETRFGRSGRESSSELEGPMRVEWHAQAAAISMRACWPRFLGPPARENWCLVRDSPSHFGHVLSGESVDCSFSCRLAVSSAATRLPSKRLDSSRNCFRVG